MNPVTTNKDVMGGTPCFAGTRVPVRTLFDHLRLGYTVEYVLENFPSVKREQIESVLHQANEQIEAGAAVILPIAS